MLKVTAKDFGPIIEGTVELKPLTVFVGPSNTGKSYMATLIYLLAVCSPIYGRYFWPFDRDFRSPSRVEPFFDVDREISKETRRAVNSWASKIDVPFEEYPQMSFGELPEELQSQTNSELKLLLESYVRSIDEGLGSFWGVKGGLTRHPNRQIQILLEQDKPLFTISLLTDALSELVETWSYDSDLSGANIVFHPSNVNRIKYSGFESNESSLHSAELYSQFFFGLLREAVHQLFTGFFLEGYYLPAGRTGIMQVHRELASARTGPFSHRANVYGASGVISDFLSRMLVMDKRFLKDEASPLASAIGYFEDFVIKGKVEFEESSDVPFPDVVYKSKWGKFPLSRTSSMVSELAPLILFLKYLVSPGDLLVLEEPESHLHPQAQRQMARGIVRLVNAGVKVLITTHSDYFLNQVNNLLRISHAGDEWLEAHGFERADCLAHEDVSAYVFRWDDEQSGSLVEELTIRPDVGIDDEEFGKVVNAQYEETILVEGIPLR